MAGFFEMTLYKFIIMQIDNKKLAKPSSWESSTK
jgi:hypothetical protein